MTSKRQPRKTDSTRSERLRTASKQRREQERSELRQTILGAAAELFLSQGYERFSLRQVAERIGYSPGTIYLYFADKDALLMTVVDTAFVRFGQQLRDGASGDGDVWARLIGVARAYVEFGLSNPVYYQLMFMQRGDFLLHPNSYTESPRIDSLQTLQRLVEEGIEVGVLPPGEVESTADALWSFTHGIVALAISVPIFDAARTEHAVNQVFVYLERMRQQI